MVEDEEEEEEDKSSPGIARFSETEQELVNLLRECVRCFYMKSSVHTSEELGRLCFDSMVNAMKRGYGETERFPDLIALVMSRHKSALGWLQDVLERGHGSDNDRSSASVRSSVRAREFQSCS